jgi:hypothetical protein
VKSESRPAIRLEYVDSRRYNIRRYGYAIGYLRRNAADEWYVGTLRLTLAAGELRAIADLIDKLNKGERSALA